MLPYNSIRYDEFFAAKAVLSSTTDNSTHIPSAVFTLSGFGDTQTSLGGKNAAAVFQLLLSIIFAKKQSKYSVNRPHFRFLSVHNNYTCRYTCGHHCHQLYFC